MALKIRTKKQFLEAYEKTATIYDVQRSSSLQGKIVDLLQREFILKKLKENKCKNVLEAGCGTGRILLFLANKGFTCFGFDL